MGDALLEVGLHLLVEVLDSTECLVLVAKEADEGESGIVVDEHHPITETRWRLRGDRTSEVCVDELEGRRCFAAGLGSEREFLHFPRDAWLTELRSSSQSVNTLELLVRDHVLETADTNVTHAAVKDVDVGSKVSLVWIVGWFYVKVVETFAMFCFHDNLHVSSNLVTHLASLRKLWECGRVAKLGQFVNRDEGE